MTTTASETIPVISIVADCLPEAWEKAVLAVWDQGFEVKTQYDKPDDPPSKDATVMIAVTDPFNEPRIHKNFPGGPEELEAYRQEVVDGIHDHWIDPAAGKWTYTYHERLFAYRPVEDLRNAERLQAVPGGQPDSVHHRRSVQGRPHPPGPGRHLDAHRRPEDGRSALPAADLVPAGRGRRGRLGAEHEHALAQPRPVQGVVHERLRADRPAADHRPRRSPKNGASRSAWAATSISATRCTSTAATSGRRRSRSRRCAGRPSTQRAWESSHPAFEMMTQEAREKLARDPDWFAKARG